MALNQCELFINNTQLMHGFTIRRIEEYLEIMSIYMDLLDGTCRLSPHIFEYKPDKEKCIECYIDIIFSVRWSQMDAYNVYNVMTHMGNIFMYAGCPVLWRSKLQT